MFRPKKDIAELVKTSSFLGTPEPFIDKGPEALLAFALHQAKHFVRGGLYGALIGSLYEVTTHSVDVNSINVILGGVIGVNADIMQYCARSLYHTFNETPSHLINK